MRIRQVKPAFWGDARIAALPEGVRLFYIGLWMLADDAGWVRWDVAEVGRELYGYETRKVRERRSLHYLARLADAGRVTIYPCGHIHVPTLKEHQHLAGLTKRVLIVEKEHAACTPQPPAGTRDDPRTPALVRLGEERVTGGQGSDSQGSPARAPGGAAGDVVDWAERIAEMQARGAG